MPIYKKSGKNEVSDGEETWRLTGVGSNLCNCNSVESSWGQSAPSDAFKRFSLKSCFLERWLNPLQCHWWSYISVWCVLLLPVGSTSMLSTALRNHYKMTNFLYKPHYGYKQIAKKCRNWKIGSHSIECGSGVLANPCIFGHKACACHLSLCSQTKGAWDRYILHSRRLSYQLVFPSPIIAFI